MSHSQSTTGVLAARACCWIGAECIAGLRRLAAALLESLLTPWTAVYEPAGQPEQPACTDDALASAMADALLVARYVARVQAYVAEQQAALQPDTTGAELLDSYAGLYELDGLDIGEPLDIDDDAIYAQYIGADECASSAWAGDPAEQCIAAMPDVAGAVLRELRQLGGCVPEAVGARLASRNYDAATLAQAARVECEQLGLEQGGDELTGAWLCHEPGMFDLRSIRLAPDALSHWRKLVAAARATDRCCTHGPAAALRYAGARA